ncbi:MAG: hypothetical protein H9W81_01045 [Enterococcus sp.]|nr:hypothetical protein [Enterococcus sp.]
MNQNLMSHFKTIISNFSETFHKEYDGHRVASPLGAWMLLAYVAVEHPKPSEKLISRLGCSPAEAKEILAALVEDTPEVIATAVNAWISPNFSFPSIQEWSDAANGIGEVVWRIPTQEELDDWTQKNSLGLMETFPLEIVPDNFVSLFATMLATKIDWQKPFDVATDKKMTKVWRQEKFLSEPNTKTGNVSFYEDETGLYAIHEATNAEETLSVLSVMSVNADTPEEDVLAVARKAAKEDISNVSYHTLTSTGSLEITEVNSSKKHDTFVTLLPAWKTDNLYKIGESETLAFDDVADRFNDFDMYMAAVQVAVAEYNRTGFEAAALTTMLIGMRSAIAMSLRKNIVVRFDHPYAVAAVVRGGTWDNLTVFDGWVSESVEVKE